MFERAAFITQMTPMLNWAAKRFSQRDHPLLARNDLINEAVIALLEVFDSYVGRKSPADLCRIGRCAVLRHLRGLTTYAFCRGEGEVHIHDLDQPIATTENNESLTLSDILGTADLEDIYFWFAFEELERSLSLLEQQVLHELLDPGERTLRAVKYFWARRPHQGNWWSKYQTKILSSAIGIPKPQVQSALRNIRSAVKVVYLGQEPPAVQYRVVPVNRNTSQTQKGDSRMASTTGKGVDPMAAGLPAASPAAAQKAAKEKKAATQPAKGKKATKPGKPAKAPKAPKAPKTARPVDPEHPFRENSNGDKAWTFLKAVLDKKGVITLPDATKAFEKQGQPTEQATGSGSYFLYLLNKKGLVARKDRGQYVKP